MAPLVLQRNLDDLIRNAAIHTHLQPIVDLRRHCALGYEALSRGEPGHLLQRPDLMFQVAHQFQRIPELEALCIKNAIRHYAQQTNSALLFLNVCPQSLLAQASDLSHFTQLLAHPNFAPTQLVLEISEQFPIEDSERFLDLIRELKALGFGIAIDDLGSGYSGLKLWSEVRPDYVKIDRHFIAGIDQDSVKQAFVTSVVHLCEQLQCEVIAEGIETNAELNVIRKLGIHIGQGYLLGRPQQQADFSLPDASHDISQSAVGLEQPIVNLCQSTPSLEPSTPLRLVDDFLRQHPTMQSVPIVENKRPLGLLHRRQLLELFALPYGRALFERKTVAHFMQCNAIIVDANTSLERVSSIMTDNTESDLHQHLMVTRQGEYIGTVNTRHLLKCITESQLQRARYANPLTLLPGNVLIDEHIEQLLGQQQPFHLLYIDLNQFKPYNDQYGYRQGDMVLRWLGKTLQSVASAQCFVGHIGGDDFVLITQNEDYKPFCEQLLSAFDDQVEQFHNTQDWARGYYCCEDRHGNLARVALLGLSIGVVPSQLVEGQNAQSLAHLAAQAKKKAKAEQRSAWYALKTPVLAISGGN